MNAERNSIVPTEEPMWTRDNEAIKTLLEMVDVKDLPIGVIQSWTDDQIREVEDWAVAFHLWAGDHDIQVPPVPEVVKKYCSDSSGFEVQSSA